MLIEEFLPDAFQKYLFQNFKQTAFNRVYNDFVPSYLHGRPRQVILHCLDRKSSSHKFQEDDIVTVSGKAGEFTVQGKKRVHTVDFGTSSGMPSCTCLDWTKNQLPCKHFFAVFKHKKEWSWNDLPQEYLCKPHISADIKALNTHFSQSESSNGSDLLPPNHNLPTEPLTDDQELSLPTTNRKVSCLCV